MSASVAPYVQHPIVSHPPRRPTAPFSQASHQPFLPNDPAPRFATFPLHNPSVHRPQPTQILSQSRIYSSPPPIAPPNMASAPVYGAPAHRTLSNSTSSSSSPRPTPSSSTAALRRSSSSRSQQPLSYVALLRRQKATAWCDRSQAEDPRILAAQRLAKERAEREVALAPGQIPTHTLNRTPPSSTAGSFTSGVARKIRHHNAPKPSPFSGGNLAGVSVPMRLSANEVDDDDDPKDDDWGAPPPSSDPYLSADAHRHSASGRSSVGSGSSRQTGGVSPAPAGRYGATGESPHSRSPSEATAGARASVPDIREERPKEDYFAVGRKGTLNDESSPETEEEKDKKEDELRRRGSVDDRAMTMRLFIANPDSDDD